MLQLIDRPTKIAAESGDQVNGETWLTATIPFESLHEARARLLALGGSVEVLAPLALRSSMQDYAGQIMKRYLPGTTQAPEVES